MNEVWERGRGAEFGRIGSVVCAVVHRAMPTLSPPARLSIRNVHTRHVRLCDHPRHASRRTSSPGRASTDSSPLLQPRRPLLEQPSLTLRAAVTAREIDPWAGCVTGRTDPLRWRTMSESSAAAARRCCFRFPAAWGLGAVNGRNESPGSRIFAWLPVGVNSNKPA